MLHNIKSTWNKPYRVRRSLKSVERSLNTEVTVEINSLGKTILTRKMWLIRKTVLVLLLSNIHVNRWKTATFLASALTVGNNRRMFNRQEIPVIPIFFHLMMDWHEAKFRADLREIFVVNCCADYENITCSLCNKFSTG